MNQSWISRAIVVCKEADERLRTYHRKLQQDLDIVVPKTTARLLITKDCVRSCKYCCNKYESIMGRARVITSLDQMDYHDIICITGGEPQLYPNRIREVHQWASVQQPKPLLFMYTTIFLHDTLEIAQLLDGIHYSLHEDASLSDIVDFQRFQYDVVKVLGAKKSYRLYINARIKHPVPVIPSFWKRVEIKAWETEEGLLKQQPNGIPAGETMYIWRYR